MRNIFPLTVLFWMLSIETTVAFTSSCAVLRARKSVVPTRIGTKIWMSSPPPSRTKSEQDNSTVAISARARETVPSSAFPPATMLDYNEMNNNKNDMMAVELMPQEVQAGQLQQHEEDKNWGSFLLWRCVVVVLCVLWASNFAAAKLVMAEPGVDSSLYAVARFSTAAIAILPGSIAAVRDGKIRMDTAIGAAKCGLWVAFGYLGQTIGLQSTTASKSCVICAMHCVFVAVLTEWMRVSYVNSKQSDDDGSNFENKENDTESFDLTRLIPAAVAVAGVAIIELRGAGGAPTMGDLFSFAQPIGFGMGYVTLEKLMKKQPEAALPVSAVKLMVVAAASLAYFELSPLAPSLPNAADALTTTANWSLRIPDFTPITSSPLALSGILYTGLVTTALALWVESIAFKRVPATDASIILTTEPLFAAAAGATYLSETFGTSDYVGASLIIGACVLAVLLQQGEEQTTEII